MSARSHPVTPLGIALVAFSVIWALVTLLAFATALFVVLAALFGWVL